MVSSTQQDGIQCQGPTPPVPFSVPNRNKKLEVEEEGEEGEKVSLLTHATARGMGKNGLNKCSSIKMNA